MSKSGTMEFLQMQNSVCLGSRETSNLNEAVFSRVARSPALLDFLSQVAEWYLHIY